ncbi:hypothetical protein LguiA_019136 [Lonicera macranthoides]
MMKIAPCAIGWVQCSSPKLEKIVAFLELSLSLTGKSYSTTEVRSSSDHFPTSKFKDHYNFPTESADLSDNFGARVRSSDEVEQGDKYCELKNEFDSAKTETLLESFGARVRVSDEVKHGDRVRVRVRVRGNVIGEGTVPLNTFVNLIRVRHSRDGESGINGVRPPLEMGVCDLRYGLILGNSNSLFPPPSSNMREKVMDEIKGSNGATEEGLGSLGPQLSNKIGVDVDQNPFSKRSFFAAECVPGRTDVQCLHRWQKVLNPELIKGPWLKEEDKRIIELVGLQGNKKWSQIAQQLPGRIGKQCRERWYNHLNPGINKAPWTKEEEESLIKAHRIYGNKWAEISKFLKGRYNTHFASTWFQELDSNLFVFSKE